MENTLFNSRPTTLLNLLGNTTSINTPVKSIEIPVIQRDYAQGRLNNKHIQQVRNNLLDAVYEALAGSHAPIDLDFIYGYCTEDGTFIPLDGQQRLTTLFLLHWYIARHEGKEIPEKMQNFRYKTRVSSRDFLEKLLSFSPSFNYQASSASYPSLSEEITDQYWCERSWTKTDPSIRSMLVMLNAIDRRFGSTSGLWEKLSSPDQPAVFFYLLILKEKELPSTATDTEKKESLQNVLRTAEDIYVKMNARGKQLSSFEHFKAYLQGLLKEINSTRCAHFMQRIDTTWSDLFWQHRAESVADAPGKIITHTLDNCLLRYYRFLTRMLAYSDNRIANKQEDDFALAKQLFAKDNPQAPAHLEALIAGFENWEKVENSYPGGCSKLFEHLFSNDFTGGDSIRLYTEINLFEKALWHFEEGTQKWTYTDAVLLWGILFLLTKNPNPTAPLQIRKIRQLRNMIWDSIGDEVRAENMEDVLSDMERILGEADFPSELKILNRRQAAEERKKEVFIREHPELYAVLCDLEDHRYLMGKIGILGFDPSTFGDRGRKFLLFFPETPQKSDMDGRKLGTTLLTYGDYSEEIKGNRRRFGGKHIKNWKPLFGNYDKKETTLRNYFGVFLDEAKTLPETGLLDKSSLLKKKNLFLADRQASHRFDWRYYFICYPCSLDSGSGIYIWEDDYDIRMLEGKQLNGWHRDVYLEMLFFHIGGDDSRWLLGRTAVKDRLLKFITLNLAFYYDTNALYIHLQNEANGQDACESLLRRNGFEHNPEKPDEWRRAIKQHQGEEGHWDEEDRIALAVELYEQLLQIQVAAQPDCPMGSQAAQ